MSKKDDMSIISLLARSKKRIKVLKTLENEDKIRSLDFLSGAVFALNLTMQKVDGFVYLIQ